MNKMTTILLVDDHAMVRSGLRALLQGEPGFRIAAEAGDGREAVRLAKKSPVDIVLMDVSMPGLNGIEATRQILAANAQTKVVALSAHSDRIMTTEMLRAGATGYVLKEAAFEELILALKTVLADKVFISPSVTGAVIEGFILSTSPDAGFRKLTTSDPTAFNRLTSREREVLQLMAEGRATKQIALELSLSAKTVETHRRNMMVKLELYNVAELTKYAIREGLTALEA